MDWAYIAGFVDGEGCIYCNIVNGKKRPMRRMRVAVRQKHRKILDWIACTTGIGKVYGPYPPHSDNYLYIVVEKQAKLFLKKTVKYLRIEKDKAKQALEWLT